MYQVTGGTSPFFLPNPDTGLAFLFDVRAVSSPWRISPSPRVPSFRFVAASSAVCFCLRAVRHDVSVAWTKGAPPRRRLEVAVASRDGLPAGLPAACAISPFSAKALSLQKPRREV